jgi:hypothetical protein
MNKDFIMLAYEIKFPALSRKFQSYELKYNELCNKMSGSNSNILRSR